MTEITLPGGLWLGGAHHRRAELRPVAGADEVLLAEERSAPPARRVTRLLGRCVRRIGDVPVEEETVRALTVGDREALLLHLRRLTLGEAMPCVLACPDCGEKLDLDLRAGDLLLPPYTETRPGWETVVEGRYRVRFRLPAGKDQEAAADCVERDGAEAAAALLLRRCVESVEDEEGRPVEDWPAAVARELPARMAELDPQAEISLDLACPACGRRFSALFDPASYFLGELGGDPARLFRQVHSLALHYHWSEPEILALTPRRRRVYLELLAEAVS
ncbi:MAG TPA: hypothetical protein VHC97_02310 [Thermoanaerobaculia bacterium]|jgi:hypothetical protein|nr:hypothetical protein [Thermoanaerobaculia bacterium]